MKTIKNFYPKSINPSIEYGWGEFLHVAPVLRGSLMVLEDLLSRWTSRCWGKQIPAVRSTSVPKPIVFVAEECFSHAVAPPILTLAPKLLLSPSFLALGGLIEILSLLAGEASQPLCLWVGHWQLPTQHLHPYHQIFSLTLLSQISHLPWSSKLISDFDLVLEKSAFSP